MVLPDCIRKIFCDIPYDKMLGLPLPHGGRRGKTAGGEPHDMGIGGPVGTLQTEPQPVPVLTWSGWLASWPDAASCIEVADEEM
jgi:hypothetical protein